MASRGTRGPSPQTETFHSPTGRAEESQEKNIKSEREREREDVFIMSGIEMMPHWVLLVSFYIQWKPHQAWQQCKTSSYYGRKRKIVEETKQYLLYIQYKYSLNGVDHLTDNLWYSEIMASTMI